MRIERAVDEFLTWRRIERDASPRSVESYQAVLYKLADDYPEVELSLLTTVDLRTFLKRWENCKAKTRATRISVLHSFFRWANREDLIPFDPSAKIERPPERKPDRYRPNGDELSRMRAAALPRERPAIVLMEGAGLRSAELRACRWADVRPCPRTGATFQKGSELGLPPTRAGRGGCPSGVVP